MIFVLLLHNIYTHCTTCFDINSTSQHNCIYYTQNTKYTNYILNKKHYIVINIYYLINASYIIQQLYLLSYKSIHIFCFTFKYYKWIFLSYLELSVIYIVLKLFILRISYFPKPLLFFSHTLNYSYFLLLLYKVINTFTTAFVLKFYNQNSIVI